MQVSGSAELLHIHIPPGWVGVEVYVVVEDEKGRQRENRYPLATPAENVAYNIPIPGGSLISVSVINFCASRFEEVWAHIGLYRGTVGVGPFLISLVECWLPGRERASWHCDTGMLAARSKGLLRPLVGAAPAAGASYLGGELFPGEWQLASLYLSLATSAVAGNRQVVLRWSAFGVALMESYAVAVQAASLTRYYQFYRGLSQFGSYGDCHAQGLPVIQSSGVNGLSVIVGGIQAGDQLSAVNMHWAPLPGIG